jgi:hypothetical protein
MLPLVDRRPPAPLDFSRQWSQTILCDAATRRDDAKGDDLLFNMAKTVKVRVRTDHIAMQS